MLFNAPAEESDSRSAGSTCRHDPISLQYGNAHTETTLDLFLKRTAILSSDEDKLYRYLLERIWDETGRICLFILLNPSIADGTIDDPTAVRCMRFAQRFQCGRLIMANAFAFRATEPSIMMAAADPVGPENEYHVRQAVRRVVASDGLCVCGWGTHGSFMNQDHIVRGWIESEGATPMALALTKHGQPRHPLYLRADTQPFPLPALPA